MPRRNPFESGTFYHAYNRGLNKTILFFYPEDYEYFIKLLFKLLKWYKWLELIEFCLLPNHFHLIFFNKRFWFDISRLIGRLCASYSKYIEYKYGKSKWVIIFEWRFKSKLLKDESYLNNCKFYVRHNAVKHWLVENMKDRKYSSHKESKTQEKSDHNKLIIKNFCQLFDSEFEYEWETEDENIIED